MQRRRRGLDALAELGIVLPITLILQAFSNLVGFGGAPRAGIKLSEGNCGEANRIFNTAVLLLGILLGVGTFCLAGQLARLFGCPASAVEFAVSYLRLSAARLASILSLGITPFVMTITECAIQIVFNINLNRATGGRNGSEAAVQIRCHCLTSLRYCDIMKKMIPALAGGLEEELWHSGSYARSARPR